MQLLNRFIVILSDIRNIFYSNVLSNISVDNYILEKIKLIWNIYLMLNKKQFLQYNVRTLENPLR